MKTGIQLVLSISLCVFFVVETSAQDLAIFEAGNATPTMITFDVPEAGSSPGQGTFAVGITGAGVISGATQMEMTSFMALCGLRTGTSQASMLQAQVWRQAREHLPTATILRESLSDIKSM